MAIIKNPLTVVNQVSSGWVRPSEWQDLPSITEHPDGSYAYFTLNNTGEDRTRFLSVFTTSAILERGHVENGRFIVDETLEQYKHQNYYYITKMPDSWGGYPAFRVRNGNNGYFCLKFADIPADYSPTGKQISLYCHAFEEIVFHYGGNWSYAVMYEIICSGFKSVVLRDVTILYNGFDFANFCKNLVMTNCYAENRLQRSSNSYFIMPAVDFSGLTITDTYDWQSGSIFVCVSDFIPPTRIAGSANFNYASFSYQSVLRIFNSLVAAPEGESRTLTLNGAVKTQLTDDELAIATDKGWTIA